MSEPNAKDGHETVSENFDSWEKFFVAYEGLIRGALRSLPSVPPDLEDDVVQSFFLKMLQKDLLNNRPTLKGRFRDWLFMSVKNHAIDEYRRRSRRPERTDPFETNEPASPAGGGSVAAEGDALYALGLLNLTLRRVRKQWEDQGKPEVWRFFDELVLAPLDPTRVAKTPAELLAEFPGHKYDDLFNRATSFKRVVRRALPALIPPDLTERQTPEEQFEEWLEILRTSNAGRNNLLWLAFRTAPPPAASASLDSSVNLLVGQSPGGSIDVEVTPEMARDELRVLLGFWLAMPLEDYLGPLAEIGPHAARAGLAPRGAGKMPPRASTFSLLSIIDDAHPLPNYELVALLQRLKTFAKRVHNAVRPGHNAVRPGREAARREHSMPAEVAQTLYNLAGVLALVRCDTRIDSLSDAQLRKNLVWALDEPWLDPRLRPVFAPAIDRLTATAFEEP